jgi:hypothetical protein
MATRPALPSFAPTNWRYVPATILGLTPLMNWIAVPMLIAG